MPAGYDERPLRVDWLEPSSLPDGRSGRLGLTFLPGKRGASFRYPGRVYRRDLDEDLSSLAQDGVATLVLLVEDHELERWGNPAVVELGAAHGVSVERFPLVDGTAPATDERMREILASISRGREAGDVAVACMGGVGRTGTVVACALVSLGWSAPDAIAEVRRVRHPSAVETSEQVAFVEAFARHVNERAG